MANLEETCLWIDTHAHLTDQQLIDQIESVVENATSSGVEKIVCIATDLKSSYQSIAVANQFDSVYASIGIHPNQCHQANQAHLNEIKTLLVNEAKAIAIGETGLDRYWDNAPFDLQKQFFRQQIEFSIELNLPLVIHMRECADDILSSLDEFPDQQLKGIMHSFVGDWELAEKFLNRGLHISFSGMVTFKKNKEMREVAARVPNDRILIETDSPYLSPEPHRGKRPNEPAQVVHTGECIASEKGLDPIEFAKLTTENAKRLFLIADG